MQIGDPCWRWANAFGVAYRKRGYVSALNRNIEDSRSNLIQTDARIKHATRAARCLSKEKYRRIHIISPRLELWLGFAIPRRRAFAPANGSVPVSPIAWLLARNPSVTPEMARRWAAAAPRAIGGAPDDAQKLI